MTKPSVYVETSIVDPVTQPSVNSSITRVRPVFRQLLGKDPTGAPWLSQVLQLSKSSGLSETTRSEPGTVLPAVSEKAAVRRSRSGEYRVGAVF